MWILTVYFKTKIVFDKNQVENTAHCVFATTSVHSLFDSRETKWLLETDIT